MKIHHTEKQSFFSANSGFSIFMLCRIRFVAGLEKTDGSAAFIEDRWERPENGGGGKTRIIENGNVFEKGGVNTSVVFGNVTDAMRTQLKIDGSRWFACGFSLVLHPLNPFVPTVHANWRYFELYDEAGEMTSTAGLAAEPILHLIIFLKKMPGIFINTLKQTLDPFGKELYPKYKKECDRYFSNHHRNEEMRGIGGIFYDYLRPSDDADAEKLFGFQEANGNAFLNAYLPIVEKRRNLSLWRK